ncbi:MAG TPA: hypothetical protein VG056_17070 [Pirellulales bacterium]|jgi:hypothetical protein|nr:hypothetical protein [Pirellulales bacterium]
MTIEQAVFTSAQTVRSRGYQLVATSPGISPEVARELTTWGPSHGSLSTAGETANSINFHPIADGFWCVSQSIAAGEEYSGRGGARVYTQSFVIAAEEFVRFANNPFALLRAIRNRGLLKVQDSTATPLAPFQLPGRSAAVDEGIAAEFVERWGAERISWLIETMLAADTLLIVGADNRESLLAGMINCLPVECRPELTFSTGLIYSPRRPFRINAIVADEVETRRLARQPGMTLLNLKDDPPADFVPSGWAAYLFEALAIDALPLVCAELERSRSGLRLSDLAWLADQLTLRLHTASDETQESAPSPDDRLSRTRGGDCKADPPRDRFAGNGKSLQNMAVLPEKRDRVAGPSKTLAAPSHEVLEKLEQLDDLVFDTISGRRPSIDELSRLWPKFAAELPPDLLAESREQYLRYAIKLWESCLADAARDPSLAVAALDVLCVLFGSD